MLVYFCSDPRLWNEVCPEWAGHIYPEIVDEAYSECRHILFAFEEFLDERIEVERCSFESWASVTAGKKCRCGLAVGEGGSPDQKIAAERISLEMNRQLEKTVGIMRRALQGAVREGYLKPGEKKVCGF